MFISQDPLHRLRCIILPPGLRASANGAESGTEGSNGAGGGEGDDGSSDSSQNGATAETGAVAGADGGEDDGDDDGDEPLGEAGTKTLAKVRGEKNTAVKARKAAEQRAAAAEANAAELQAKLDGREAEHQAQQDQARIESEAIAKAHGLIRKAEVRALAAGKLADPEDALRFIDLDEFEVGEDGSVDRELIGEAITELLTARPYLAAGAEQRFQGGGDGGADKGSRQPRQLKESDIDNMTPAEVNAALNNGQLKNLMSGKR